MGIRGIEALTDEPVPYGIRKSTGEIVTDPTWFNEADVIRSMIGWGKKQASEHGVLVKFIDGEWIDA